MGAFNVSGTLSFFGKMTMILLPGEATDGAMSPERKS